MNKRELAFSHWLFTIIAALFLTACGGGGGDSLLDLQGVSTYKLSVTSTSATLGPSGSLVVSATLKDSSGTAASDKTIQFSSTGPGALSAASGVTNASGVATVTLNGNGGAAGAGTVKATFTDGSNNVVTSGISYSVINGDNIALTLSKNTVKSGIGDTVALTAFLTDSSGNVQVGKAISFSVAGSASGSIAVAKGGVTDNAGLVTATYTPDTTDRSNKTVVINAASALSPSVTDSGTINITGTTIKLTASPTTTTLNSSISLDGTVTDGQGAAIGSQAITLSSPNLPGGQVTVTTDATGKIPTQTVVITSASSGVATFTGTGVGATGSTSVTVSGTNFSFSSPLPSEEITVSTNKTVTLTYLNNGAPVSGQTIFFSTSLGTMTPSSAVTNASGQASSTLASSSAGQAVISANTAGAVFQASRNVLFVGGTPTQVAIQVGQTTLAPNGQTQITATVRDASNNPVKGKVVQFNVISDPSLGSGLSSSLATTDAIGQAVVSYTAGALTTATNGIKIRASVQGTAVTTTPSVAPLDAQLTVGGQAVFISIGSGNTMTPLDTTTYADPHNVVITDATGAPVSNQVVTLSVIPVRYYKGYYVKSGSGWVPSGDYVDPITGFFGQTPCSNEDTNFDGVIQAGEDINSNGRLDPGNPVTLSSATVTTGNNGFASFSVLYGKNFGNWLSVRLRVTTKVNGTESQSERFYDLPVLAPDVANESAAPPGGGDSPFGRASSCTNPL